MNLPDDLVEPDLQNPDLQNPDLLNPELILKQDLLVPALYVALPKSNIPELISEDDDGSMIFILNGNGFDIGGYNGEDIIRSSYSGYATRILMADERTPSKLGFDEDMKEEINNLEISLRAEIIPIDGVSYVRLTLYVENTTDDEEIGFSLGIDADTCVGVDDRAKSKVQGMGSLCWDAILETTDIRIMSMPLLSKTMMRVTLPLTDGGTVIMGNGPSIYSQGICLRGI